MPGNEAEAAEQTCADHRDECLPCLQKALFQSGVSSLGNGNAAENLGLSFQGAYLVSKRRCCALCLPQGEIGARALVMFETVI